MLLVDAPPANAASSGPSQESSRASRDGSETSGHGSPSSRRSKARRRRNASAAVDHPMVASPSLARARATAARPSSAEGRTGVEDRPMAPSRRSRRALTRPWLNCASTVSVRSCLAAASAVSAFSGAAERITAPVPAASRPAARETSATASHSCPASGLPAGNPARVPDESRYRAGPSPGTRRATRSGNARATTTPTASAAVTGAVPASDATADGPTAALSFRAIVSNRRTSSAQRLAAGSFPVRSAVSRRVRSAPGARWSPATRATASAAAR